MSILLIVGAASSANACLPDSYKRIRTHCVEGTSFDRLLSIVFTDTAKPRQIAILAGVSKYPNLSRTLQLPAAANDIEMLRVTLIDKLQFDEIITLQNEDFNFANLQYVFENYLPDVLRAYPKSRVLFAFSGRGSDFDDYGYLYFQDTRNILAEKYADLTSAINLSSLKIMMGPTIKNAQHFLALINACKGGYFLDVGVQFGANSLEERGAHGITAGSARDAVHAYSNVGSGKGSVFFELVVAALSQRQVIVGGRTFEAPSKDDGILTTTRLADFLATTISIIEDYKISPRMGALMARGPGNQGEFFFITNYDLAKTTLGNRFSKNAERVFGTSSTKHREGGLYATADIPAGKILRTEMFSSAERTDDRSSDNQFPSSFPDHVRGSCLELPVKKGDRLTWQHLRSDCR
jgi:hypothetical protein